MSLLNRLRRVFVPALTVFALLIALPLHGQIRDSALSEKEIEQVRDARLVPGECVLLFVKFLDQRAQAVHDLYAKPRRPGREEDTRDLIMQFNSIADELADNLDDYGPRHADLRKALPKVIDATDRWATQLKSPPEDDTYTVQRKLALESIRDLRESASEMENQQTAWFKAHPPTKQKNEPAGPIDIPR